MLTTCKGSDAVSISEPTLLDEIATDVADRVCQMVVELLDRTSPDDQPEMMLVTGDELHDIVCQAIQAADAEWQSKCSARIKATNDGK